MRSLAEIIIIMPRVANKMSTVFEPGDALGFEVILRNDNRQARNDHNEDLHEYREVVDDEHVSERQRGTSVGYAWHQQQGQKQCHRSDPGDEPGGLPGLGLCSCLR